MHSATIAPLLLLLLASPERPDLTGTVTDPDGQPVAGATVFVYTAAVKAGTNTLCPSCYPDCAKRTTTDADGMFVLPKLDPQLLFRILVAADGYEPTFATKVDPKAGPLDVSIKPRPAATQNDAHLIRGRVVDDLGKPVVGAVLNPNMIRRGTRRHFGLDLLDPVAVTNEQGEFLVASRGPFDGATFHVEARGLAKEITHELSPGEKNARIELSTGCIVTGRLLRDGEPVVGAEVGLVQESRNSESFLGTWRIGTDEDGIFLFDNVSPNEKYVLHAITESIPAGGVTVVKHIKTRSDGQRLNTGVLEVVRGAVLSGRVILADGKPIPPGIRLGLYREEAWDSSRSELDEEGRFTLRAVPSEPVTLSLRIPGYKLSDRNRSYLALRGNLTGIIERDRDDLLILMEPGEREFSWPLGEEQRRGFERERHLMTQPLEGVPADWKTAKPVTPGNLD